MTNRRDEARGSAWGRWPIASGVVVAGLVSAALAATLVVGGPSRAADELGAGERDAAAEPLADDAPAPSTQPVAESSPAPSIDPEAMVSPTPTPAPTSGTAATSSPEVVEPVGAAESASVVSDHSNWSGADACADVLVIGVRGSGERATDNEGYGRIVRTVRDGLRDQVDASLSVREVALDYPSLPILPEDDFDGSLVEDIGNFIAGDVTIDYYDSVLEGWLQLSLAIQDSRNRCASQPERMVLVGYSQGALVIHKVLAEIASFPELAAVVLVADPARVVDSGTHTDVATMIGTATPGKGIWHLGGIPATLYNDAMAPIPDEFAAKTAEVCNAHDAVCAPDAVSIGGWVSDPNIDYGVDIHLAYGTSQAFAGPVTEKALADMGRWAGRKVNAEFVLPQHGDQWVGRVFQPGYDALTAGAYGMAATSDGTAYLTSGGNRRTIWGYRPSDGWPYSALSVPSPLNPAYAFMIAADRSDNIYSTNTYSKTLVVYRDNGTTTIDISGFNTASWGREGSPLAVDSDGNIYLGNGYGGVYDGCGYSKGVTGAAPLTKLSPQGDLLTTFDVGQFRAITADARGNVYVLTTGSEILRIDALGAVDVYATMPSTFGWIGASMAADSAGNLYLINSVTVSCFFSPITPDPSQSPVWRVDADTRDVVEWAPAERGRSKLAMGTDDEVLVYIYPYPSWPGSSVGIERLAVGTPAPFGGTPSVSISGDETPGALLTAASDGWDPAPTDVSYQWLRDGSPIPGATGPQYVIQAADAGRLLAVAATGSRLGYVTRDVTSAPVRAIDPAFPPEIGAGTVAISGERVVGGVLTGAPSGWTPAAATLTYQWLRDGGAIPGATGASYRVQPVDAGRRLAVQVTGSRLGYVSRSRSSSAVVPSRGDFVLAGDAVISGRAVIGSQLRASSGEWTPRPGSVTYRWTRDGRGIPSASGPTYVLQVADVGRRVGVTVSVAATGFTAAATSVELPAPVSAGTFTAPRPTIAGRPVIASQLSARAGAWTPTPDRVAYVWRCNGRPIQGATLPTYVVRASDAGCRVTVTVTGQRAGYTATSVTSAQTAAVTW